MSTSNEVFVMIGDNLRGLRLKMRLTQEELAQMCGWDHKMKIYYFEKGQRTPSLEDICKLAEVLHCPVEHLIKRNETLDVYIANDKIRPFPIFTKEAEIMEFVKDPVIKPHHSVIYLAIDNKQGITEKAYSIKHTGSAMVDRTNIHQSIFDGELLIIAPDMEPKDGKIVLVKFGDNDIRLRKYVKDGQDVLLKAFDPDVKTIVHNPSLWIAGVVIGTYREF